MIKYNDVFNKYTLNIFTDASMGSINNETIGVPGYIMVDSTSIPFKTKIHSQVLRNTTNNECELYAIYMAIQEAIIHKENYKIINIFSDSQFSVFGLREWIFKWCNNIKDDNLYNSSGNIVANQKIFMNIIYTILQYDLCINIYHNRGHFKNNQIDEFINLFKKHNFLNDYIDYETAKAIMMYNDKVDQFTREKVRLLNQSNLSMFPYMEIPIYLARDDLDLNHYKDLLNI